MRLRAQRQGFSLIEVVIAVAIFAVAVVAIIRVLPTLTRQAAESAEMLTAQRLPDAVRIELTRLSRAGWEALHARIPVMSAPLSNGLTLIATREGEHVQSIALLPPPAGARVVENEQFFLIEAWRFNADPMNKPANAGVLPVHVRVSWPYRVAGAPGPTLLSHRAQFTFNLAIVR